MSSISKILVQQSHLEIFSAGRSTSIDLKGWVANQNYYVDSDLVANDYSVRASDKDYLKMALANDCNRMAIAAIESVSGIQPDNKLNKSGAWGVIRAYYASFFAVHSMMRMFGISCSLLDQSHVDKIYESAEAVGKTGSINKLNKGFYSIRIDKSFEKVVFHKYKDSHKDTWGEFLGLIDKLIDESAQNGIEVKRLYGDSAYADLDRIESREEAGMEFYVKVSKASNKKGFFSKEEFEYLFNENQINHYKKQFTSEKFIDSSNIENKTLTITNTEK